MEWAGRAELVEIFSTFLRFSARKGVASAFLWGGGAQDRVRDGEHKVTWGLEGRQVEISGFLVAKALILCVFDAHPCTSSRSRMDDKRQSRGARTNILTPVTPNYLRRINRSLDARRWKW